jgi:hypothetical protein
MRAGCDLKFDVSISEGNRRNSDGKCKTKRTKDK